MGSTIVLFYNYTVIRACTRYTFHVAVGEIKTKERRNNGLRAVMAVQKEIRSK